MTTGRWLESTNDHTLPFSCHDWIVSGNWCWKWKRYERLAVTVLAWQFLIQSTPIWIPPHDSCHQANIICFWPAHGRAQANSGRCQSNNLLLNGNNLFFSALVWKVQLPSLSLPAPTAAVSLPEFTSFSFWTTMCWTEAGRKTSSYQEIHLKEWKTNACWERTSCPH